MREEERRRSPLRDDKARSNAMDSKGRPRAATADDGDAPRSRGSGLPPPPPPAPPGASKGRDRGGARDEPTALAPAPAERERAPRTRTVEDPYAMAAKTAAGTEAGGNKTGGLYLPPWKLAQMMKEVTDKTSKEYQRMRWDALKKAINGLVNKVNVSNLKQVVLELFGENIIRGRALIVNLPGQPKAIRETLEGVRDADGKVIVHGIFSAVPYCIDLIGGPYLETNDEVCRAFRPKSAVRPPRAAT